MEHLPFTRDLQDCAALFHCCLCQGEIYAGERYYQTDEGPVCLCCLTRYTECWFYPLLRTAEPCGTVEE